MARTRVARNTPPAMPITWTGSTLAVLGVGAVGVAALWGRNIVTPTPGPAPGPGGTNVDGLSNDAFAAKVPVAIGQQLLTTPGTAWRKKVMLLRSAEITAVLASVDGSEPIIKCPSKNLWPRTMDGRWRMVQYRWGVELTRSMDAAAYAPTAWSDPNVVMHRIPADFSLEVDQTLWAWGQTTLPDLFYDNVGHPFDPSYYTSQYYKPGKDHFGQMDYIDWMTFQYSNNEPFGMSLPPGTFWKVDPTQEAGYSIAGKTIWEAYQWANSPYSILQGYDPFQINKYMPGGTYWADGSNAMPLDDFTLLQGFDTPEVQWAHRVENQRQWVVRGSHENVPIWAGLDATSGPIPN